MELPNWLRIVLLLLSVVSFLPQLRLLYVRKDSAGLSLFYLLFNLIVATELFTLSFIFVVNYAREEFAGPDLFVHDPLNAGDRMNLAQFALVWVLWLVIFIASLAWRSDDPDHSRRRTVAILYLSFLLISVGPVFIDAVTDHSRDQYHSWGLGMFVDVHLLLVVPVVSILGIVAVVAQARAITGAAPGSGLGALSLAGLVAQGLVFALLALSWPWRLAFPWDEVGGDWLQWAVLKAWLQVAGFVAVDYAVFALGQFVLLWVAVRRGLGHGGIERVSAGDETEPLLGS
ncbi:hypothetical protein QBC40DRAFT_345362 [Triangularia verruculosa]|uniref:Uncharacterized protein n=1 Tax=Triangularia verruculosa TaxID=2587418 RepID=A0AAN6XVU2_9PEZI|nr:hypothetical protein QBC40DRAFT_345362 [Triangularia verruculosa]